MSLYTVALILFGLGGLFLVMQVLYKGCISKGIDEKYRVLVHKPQDYQTNEEKEFLKKTAMMYSLARLRKASFSIGFLVFIVIAIFDVLGR